MARNVAGVGRHYVSARLVRETGVTMRAHGACNWLYVRGKLNFRSSIPGEAHETGVPRRRHPAGRRDRRRGYRRGSGTGPIRGRPAPMASYGTGWNCLIGFGGTYGSPGLYGFWVSKVTFALHPSEASEEIALESATPPSLVATMSAPL